MAGGAGPVGGGPLGCRLLVCWGSGRGIAWESAVEWVGSRPTAWPGLPAATPLLVKLFLAAETFVLVHMWRRTSPRDLPRNTRDDPADSSESCSRRPCVCGGGVGARHFRPLRSCGHGCQMLVREVGGKVAPASIPGGQPPHPGGLGAGREGWDGGCRQAWGLAGPGPICGDGGFPVPLRPGQLGGGGC